MSDERETNKAQFNWDEANRKLAETGRRLRLQVLADIRDRKIAKATKLADAIEEVRDGRD